MDSRVEHTQDGTVLTLYGDVTIENAVELRKVLAGELAAAAGLTVNLAYVTHCDLSLFQLLCAAHRTSAAVRLSEVSPAVGEAMASSGLIRGSGCTGGPCLWQRTEGVAP
jgi:anti-anti-sigma regulatory factor